MDVDLLNMENRELKERVEKLEKAVSSANLLREDAERKYNIVVHELRRLRRETVVEPCHGETIDNDDKCEGKSTQDAVLVFPEEIWVMIFANLEDWKDLWNCSRACLLFHKMLHSSKTTFLFPAIFPFLVGDIGPKKILECRTICKKWNEGVDNFFENHPHHRPHSKNNCDPGRLLPFVNLLQEVGLGRCFSFKDDQYGTKCNTRMGNHPRNPFLGRAFHIQFNWETLANDTYIPNVYRFLETFGQHIWYLTVSTSSYYIDAATPEVRRIPKTFTADLFRLIPHLRKLRIIDQDDKIPNPELFPVLSSFETLDIEDVILSHTPYPFHNKILTQFHSQLKRLHVQEDTWEKICHMEWPSLVELHVKDLNDGDFATLKRLRIPQLRKLGLSVDGWQWSKCSRWSLPGENIDKMLNTLLLEFPYNQLNSLRIKGKITDYDVRPRQHRMEVEEHVPKRNMPPRLKTLELEYSAKSCYSFLLRFPFLENLNLFEMTEARWDNGAEVRLFHYATERNRRLREDRENSDNDEVDIKRYVRGGQLYESNIWELLPRLKVLTFQWTIYTREGYERHCRGRQLGRQVNKREPQNLN